MRARKLFPLLLTGLLVAGLFAPATVSAKAKKKKSGPVVVGTDDAGDWGANTDPSIGPIGDALGMDLVAAEIAMADKKTVNFVIKLNSLPPSGGFPEVPRYIWSFTVDGNYAELDGKWTNYSRGACDPTSGQCPPPRDPGQQPFLLRGDCATTSAGSNVTTCQELGIVQAVFDPNEATITIPVPAALIKAKPGSKIATGSSSFSSLTGGPIIAMPSAFLSSSPTMPADTMQMLKTFVVPKK